MTKVKFWSPNRPIVPHGVTGVRIWPSQPPEHMLRCLGRSRQSGRFFLKLINNSFCLRSNLKHSTQCFITRLNISKFVKNTPLRVVFSTLLAAFHLVMKHCLSCLLYYLKTWLYGTNYNSSKGEHAFLKVTNNVRFMFCMYTKACMYDALIPNTDHWKFHKEKNPF